MSSVLKVGVFIPYHKKLSCYLDAVQDCYSKWHSVIACEFDFKVTPEEVARNFGVSLFKDCDLLFTVDADEFMTREDQIMLVNKMASKGHDGAFCRVVDYTSDMNHAYKIREHKPITVIKPKEVMFWQGRCIRGVHNALITDDFTVHHMGYTFDDETMDWKNANYWDQKNPQDVEQVMARDVIDCQLPDEITQLMEKHKCLKKATALKS